MRIYQPTSYFSLIVSAHLFFSLAVHAVDVPHVVIPKSSPAKIQDLPWQFYWKQFIYPQNFFEASPVPDLILQPVTAWNKKVVRGETLGSWGYATYRVRFRSEVRGQRLALRLPAPFTSYRLYVNGAKLAEEGRVATNIHEFLARRKSALIFFTPTSNEIDIVIHVANFISYKGGLRGQIELGLATEMQAWGLRYLAIDLICIGLIFSIMIYHFLIFLLTPRDIPILIFAVLALDYFLLAFFYGEQSISLFVPELPLHLHIRLSSMLTYILPALVIEFTAKLYQGTISRRIKNAYWAIALLFICLLLLPPRYFSYYNVFYYGFVCLTGGIVCIWGLQRAVREGRAGARLLAFGMLILVALSLYAVYLFSSNRLAGSFLSIGFALFALAQSGSLAHVHAALRRENSAMQLRLERSRAALESQRKQIEANLHDSLGGNLIDIKLGLEVLEKKVHPRGLTRDIRRLDHRVAGTIASLRTELLFLEDLQLAMKDFVSGVNLILLRRYQMARHPVEIRITPETRELGRQLEKTSLLGDEIKPELCMMIQELCSNSLKYASGTAYWEIFATEKNLQISVMGKSRHRKKQAGMGKQTLRRRAEIIQAKFSESIEGGFYQASVIIP